MCLKTQKPPAPPKVAPAPNRDTAAVEGTQQRKRLQKQSGVFNNIFTSALGDTNYGTSAVSQRLATLGA